MSALSVPTVSPSTRCLAAEEAVLGFRNVWIEPGPIEVAAGLDLRCVALAIDPEQLSAALAALGQAPVAIAPRIYPQAAITHLYRDGRSHQIAVVQLEFVVRLEGVAAVLATLDAAKLLPRAQDRMVLVRGLARALGADCQIFPAGARAAYSHFVRWRRGPTATARSMQASPI